MRGKMLLRELWSREIKWVEILNEDLLKTWNNWINELKVLMNLKIPRPYIGGTIIRTELIGFGDASEICYAATVYIRATLKDGSIETRFAAAIQTQVKDNQDKDH